MSDSSPHVRSGSPETIAPRALERWVRAAAVFILIMAVYGLYRGVAGVRGGTGLLPNPRAGNIVAPVDAANAAPAPKDPQWSTLSGPQVITPPRPGQTKPAKAAATDEDQDASDGPTDKSAAASADDAALDDAPSPKAKLPKPVPIPDEAAPPASGPDAP